MHWICIFADSTTSAALVNFVMSPFSLFQLARAWVNLSSRCLHSMFKQGFNLPERNWMILLSESAMWFKGRNKRMLWRSFNLKTGKRAPTNNIVLRLFFVPTVCRLNCHLQNWDTAFLNPLNFLVLLAQQNRPKSDHKTLPARLLLGCQVLLGSIELLVIWSPLSRFIGKLSKPKMFHK